MKHIFWIFGIFWPAMIGISQIQKVDPAAAIQMKNNKKDQLFELIEKNLDSMDIFLMAKKRPAKNVAPRVIRVYRYLPPVMPPGDTPPGMAIKMIDRPDYEYQYDSTPPKPKKRGLFYRIFH